MYKTMVPFLCFSNTSVLMVSRYIFWFPGKIMCQLFLLITVISALFIHGVVDAQGVGVGSGASLPPKPASFVFGDSLVDPGNNNYIASTSRAYWPPYGVDFAPSGFRPTGRFTNGRTLADIIGQELGQESLSPPYLSPTAHGEALLNGVNYASGAGGILDSSGAVFLARLSFDTQINYFENTRRELVHMLDEEMTKRFLNRSLFSIVFGSNDYLDNYLLPFSVTKARYSPQDYEDLLISRFADQLNRLYQLGARKIIVSGVGPIGCIPYQLSNAGSINGECIDATNKLVLSFNSRIRDLISSLNSNLPNAAIIYLNTYDLVTEIIQNYHQYGFINVNTACCGSGGRFRGRVSCLPTSPYCGEDRHKYFFFDTYHPSEAGNLILAAKFLDGGLNYAYPINIRQLVAM